jgi:hypothetical protein
MPDGTLEEAVISPSEATILSGTDQGSVNEDQACGVLSRH